MEFIFEDGRYNLLLCVQHSGLFQELGTATESFKEFCHKRARCCNVIKMWKRHDSLDGYQKPITINIPAGQYCILISERRKQGLSEHFKPL